MNKKIAIISVILLVAGLAIIIFFIRRDKEKILTDPYTTITRDAAIVIETVNLRHFANLFTLENGLTGELSGISELAPFYTKLKALAAIVNKPESDRFVSGSSALISFYNQGNGNFSTLLSMSAPAGLRTRHLRDYLKSVGLNFNMVTGKGKSRELEIPFEVSGERDTVFIALVSGLIVCSDSRTTLDNARTQVSQDDDIRKAPGFSRVLLASGKKVDKVFIVFGNIREFIKPLVAKSGDSPEEKILHLAGTAGGDIDFGGVGLVLSGYIECTDQEQLLYKYKSIPSGSFHSLDVLPSSTVLFETRMGFDVRPYPERDSTISGQTPDIAEKLREYAGEELTRAYIDMKDSTISDDQVVIYELANRVLAEQAFVESLGKKKEITWFEPDDQVRIPVYKASLRGLSQILAPGFARDFDDNYFAFEGNFLVTGSSFSTVSKVLYDNLLKKTLSNDVSYRDFERTLTSRAGYYFYCVPRKLIRYLNGRLSEALVSGLKANRSSLNKFKELGYQLSASNGMIYNSLSIRFSEEETPESTTEWETLLDTTACIKPFFFTNHNTRAREIFIQDLDNNIYLINAAGRVLWKVRLNERIISTVFMIDYFGNGKKQLLFSGRNFLHVIDRNGNYVERYPVRLRSPATSPLAVYSPDNNLNYRLYVACDDKIAYAYDKKGNVLKDWKLFTTTGTVTSEINLFRLSGKDYLVLSDEYSIYFLDRKGSQTVKLKEPAVRAKGSAMRLDSEDKCLVCSAPDGMVLRLYSDGSVKKFSLHSFSESHTFDYFDIDGDGLGEYVFIDKGILYLYDHNREELFARDFGSQNLGGPLGFVFSPTDRMIGVFDIDRKLIYLIGRKGETMNGFPLRGASMFSIGKLSDKTGWHLIVGGTDRYLYNYKLEEEIK